MYFFDIFSLFCDVNSMELQGGGPGSNPGLVMWDLWWTKWRWDRYSPSNSVSPAKLHSTNFSTIPITITRGWNNRPVVAAVPKVPPHKLKKKKKKGRPRKRIMRPVRALNCATREGKEKDNDDDWI
jgi:hypothetical protein